MKFEDWGVVEYEKAWKRQQELFDQIIQTKKENLPTSSLETIVFCEHPHVYTLGKSGNSANLLVNSDFLKSAGATFYKIDRGGDITYHGPGQIVGYPILDLDNHDISLKEYIRLMEESIIAVLKDEGIDGFRLAGATGVWLNPDTPSARKICAIGVKASRFVTMHGFALNVNTNLDFFNYINPCGFVNKGVTSMQKELDREVNIDNVKKKLAGYLIDTFGK